MSNDETLLVHLSQTRNWLNERGLSSGLRCAKSHEESRFQRIETLRRSRYGSGGNYRLLGTLGAQVDHPQSAARPYSTRAHETPHQKCQVLDHSSFIIHHYDTVRDHMNIELTSLDRVTTVLRGGIPDRVPVDLHNFLMVAQASGCLLYTSLSPRD